jgi:hypothetical protein
MRSGDVIEIFDDMIEKAMREISDEMKRYVIALRKISALSERADNDAEQLGQIARKALRGDERRKKL